MDANRKKIAVIFGTRPDTIKLAPVIQELQKFDNFFTLKLIATAQHREMLDDVLRVFKIEPDYDLNIMHQRQSLTIISRNILDKLDYVFAMENPDLVVVQGDTATTFISSIAAFHRKITVAHVEAGLRTNDRMNPYPEETYRRLTSHVADMHFTPTVTASKALIKEGIAKQSIMCTGNTVIDALVRTVQPDAEFFSPRLREVIARQKRMVIVTAHRRENLGEPMMRISAALKELSIRHLDIEFVFPVHPNPEVQETVHKILDGVPNITLLEPLKYSDFINLVARCYFVITDSGGLQEEAPSLGKPVLVMRDVTERPEAVDAGTVKLVGTQTDSIVDTADALLRDRSIYQKMATAVNPYGDGKASSRIATALLRHFGFTKAKLNEFSPRKM